MPQAARLPALIAAGALALAACGDSEGEGGGGSSEVRGDADPADVEVIDAWSSALREGEVEEAAGYFALPSVAENGPTLAEIDSREDAEVFNRSLPCGAVLVRATDEGEFTIATFRLTERPGPGSCGDGTGALARTEFLIEDDLIVEWRRVPIDPAPVPGEIT
jgi:hypothetical protein